MSGEGGERKPGGAPGDAHEPARARARPGRILVTLAAVLGFGPRKKREEEPGAGATDASTRLAYERTDLAYERTDLALERSYLGSERTLMAWIRTALSMISFGFTLGKLGEAFKDIEVKGFLGRYRMMSVERIAYFLVILGTFALLVATVQHVLRTREFVALGFRPQFSTAVAVAALLVLVGGFALTALVLKM